VTSAAVFLPIIVGEKDQISIFMTHVAVAIVVSLVVSLFIAQTIIPLLASRIDRPASSKQNAIVDRLKDRYVRLLHWNMRHRWLAAAMVILTLVSAAIPMSIVETDMFPQDQTRQLYLNFNLDGSYPLAKLKESVDRIENYLYGNQELFEIRAVYTYYSEQGDAMSVILLKDDDEAERSAHEISTDILDGLPKIAIGQPAFGFDRVGGGEKLNITLTGSSSKVLQELGDDAVRILSSVEGLTGVVSAASAGDQEVQVRVDRERANQLGFSTQEVAQAVSIAIRGTSWDFQPRRSPRPSRLPSGASNCVNSRVRKGKSRSDCSSGRKTAGQFQTCATSSCATVTACPYRWCPWLIFPRAPVPPRFSASIARPDCA
jgi:HAE1 family hydrophobic/amphiphilic exporter-1